MAKEMPPKQQIGEMPKKPLGFFFYAAGPAKWWAVFATFVVVLAETLGQLSYIIFQKIIDAAGTGNTTLVILLGIGYPLVVYFIQLLWRVSGLLGMRWSTTSRAYVTEELTKYLLDHSHNFFANRFAGSLLSNMNNVIDSTGSFVENYLWTHLSTIVSLVVTCGLLMSVDTRVGLTFLVFIGVLLVLNTYLVPQKRRLSEKSAAAVTALRGHTVDVLTNMSAVRQFSMRGREFAAIKERIEYRKKRQQMNWRYSEYMLFINCTMLFLFTSGMLYFLITGWSAGSISTGQFVLVLSLVANLAGTLIFISQAFNSTAESYGEMKEGLEALLSSHEITEVAGAQKLQASGGEVKWKDVVFKYGEADVFRDFSLQIPAGQRVGLVGPSGAGKTTFVSLMLRQHDLNGGVIEIDGQNIAEVTQDSLREAITIVPQEPMLFHRTIRENIAYGKPDATLEEIERAAAMAQIHDFVTTLPEGYETLVGERGVKLSGGQRQRIAIARAMLKDAPILVLDEATSALDSESEVAIQKALRVLMEGKTVVAIAHRLSTLREMDRIIVLDKGVIVEDGTHDELLKSEGLYARLWQHQAGGFLQEE